jgi:hypothetical protein
MDNRITIALALVAGLTGGAMSHCLLNPSTARAQTVTPAPQEVRARKFVLVDESGAPRGAFGIETDGTAQIEVTDAKGRLWVYRTDPARNTWSGRVIEDRPKVLTLLH